MAYGFKEIMLQIKTTTTTQPLFFVQMKFTRSIFVMIMPNPGKAQMIPLSPRKNLAS